MSGTPAPDFTLKHTAGHMVSLSDYRGTPVALIFSGRDSIDQAREIGWAVREVHRVEAVQIVIVLDLSEIPRMMASFARSRVQVGYEDLVRETITRFEALGYPLPDDIAQIVIMLPDWDGKVTASYGLKGVAQQTVAVLVDAEGTIVGQATGPDAPAQFLALFA